MDKKAKKVKNMRIASTIMSLIMLAGLVGGILLIVNDEMFYGLIALGIAVLNFIITIPMGNYVGKHCKKCNNPLRGCEYEWTVIKQKTQDVKESDGSYSVQYTLKYLLRYTCPNCGHVFEEKISQMSKHGFGDCEIKMNNYCTKRFGH